MNIEIEYISTPDGPFTLYTPLQVECNTENAAWFSKAAQDWGYREDRPDEEQPPEALNAHRLGESLYAELSKDMSARAFAEQHGLTIHKAVFECRDLNRLDRLVLQRFQTVEKVNIEAATEEAWALLNPQIISGWEGELSPHLKTYAKWECFFRINTMGRESQETA